ncbi:MAG: hypothetical protein L0Z73_10470 [Gammaproteobacteria bacterium]|nr:hypothetical protein [Gammaproteobacteria bacterium]
MAPTIDRHLSGGVGAFFWAALYLATKQWLKILAANIKDFERRIRNGANSGTAK